jgi:DNA-binding LacI/PurR family transcriptional regulator
MRITIGELAKIAGVSKTTISRVINSKPDVDPGTREKILSLIAQYGFQPNAFAKAISQKQSNHIGLLIPHKAEYVFSNPFYTEVMRGVSTAVDENGYYLLICYAHEVNYMNIYKQKRVDGFVLLSPGSFHKHIIEALNVGSVPFVSTARLLGEAEMTYVDVDNFTGASMLMEHLVSLGHERIAFIGKPTLQSSQDRLSAYQAILEKAGIKYDPELVLVTDTSSVESGHEYALRLLRAQKPPTAIFLANDVMAIGAINAAHESGLRVPEDISIVGFDDIPFSNYTNPPLTTVHQPAFEKGVRAAGLLINLLETQEPQESVILPMQMAVRKSTAPARK